MEKGTTRIAIAQINSTVGDLNGNAAKILQCLERLRGFDIDIVSFPELALTGYPPEDLLLKPQFIADNLRVLKDIAIAVDGMTAILGFVDRQGSRLYNAAALIHNGAIRGICHKMLLPNYGVFDEKRYFAAGERCLVFKLGDSLFGINICEDIWYEDGPTRKQAACGARVIININASPYHAGKLKERTQVLRRQAKVNRVFISYTNLVGGQDELVFDGSSMVMGAQGEIVARAESFREDILITDLKLPAADGRLKPGVIDLGRKPSYGKRVVLPKRKIKPLGMEEEIYRALMLGLSDYVRKNGFQKVVIGLSGGIDSALVATLAADALGCDNTVAVFMPSRYSSGESREDAEQLSGNLGIKLMNIPIEQIYRMYLLSLEPHFLGSEKNITEENLQARIRGNLLMALSNKFGWLVLTTGNKSEMSTGYATLYGDMAGGFAVIKDIPKTMVYRLTEYRNALAPVIPDRILTKEPTAELKPGQKDSDTLLPYPELDPILKAYVEEDRAVNKIVSLGFEKSAVKNVVAMVDRNEYKRLQSPPGIKITSKAFGKDRRMPITNGYRG